MIRKLYEKLYFLEKNGTAHGLIMLVVLTVVWWSMSWFYSVGVVGVIGSGYYYYREAKARETLDIRQWYTDSQFDAITPAVVSFTIVLMRYL